MIEFSDPYKEPFKFLSLKKEGYNMSPEYFHWYHSFQLNVIWSLYYPHSRLEFSEADLLFYSQIRTSHWPMCWKRWSVKQEGGRHIRIVKVQWYWPGPVHLQSKVGTTSYDSTISLNSRKCLPFTAPTAIPPELEHLLWANDNLVR